MEFTDAGEDVARRKTKKWTQMEEVALRRGVERLGTGSWKQILQMNEHIFSGRTGVDLKDKWRNLSRSHKDKVTAGTPSDGLTAKVDNVIELHRTHADLEADLSSKLANVERQFNEASSSLQWNKDRVRELEMRVTALQEELCMTKRAAAANEKQFATELSTVNKLVELYKESSEAWSKKAGELEGVIKALEATVLLKECQGIENHDASADDDSLDGGYIEMNSDSASKNIIQLIFKDINGLVEQNAQIRGLVHNDEFGMTLEECPKVCMSGCEALLQLAKEEWCMIEFLHTAAVTFQRLYEKEHKLHLAYSQSEEAAPEGERTNLKLPLEGSQEAATKAKEQVAERVKYLEEELEKSRSEVMSLRAECDKFGLETRFARERLDSFMKALERERNETNGILARNVEFSQLIVDYQRKLQESSESLNAAEEVSRKLTMQVSVLKHEKEMLVHAEKRARDEVHSLSERVYRLQACLDTIQSAEQVHEEARVAERKKQEEYVKQIQKEWAEAKELQEERENVRSLAIDREETTKTSMRQVEEMGKDLANALHAVTAAESKAAIPEDVVTDGGSSSFLGNVVAKEEIEKFNEEGKAYEGHMQQSATAQSSVHAERASSRSLLLTEDEIKSLQLQVREMNLLDESNMQLREENERK